MTPSAWPSLKQLTFSLYTTNTTHIVIIERGSKLVDKEIQNIHVSVLPSSLCHLTQKKLPNTDFSLQEPYSVPLGIAAERGDTETVQRLLEAGATVNYQNKVYTVVGLSEPHNRFPLIPTSLSPITENDCLLSLSF